MGVICCHKLHRKKKKRSLVAMVRAMKTLDQHNLGASAIKSTPMGTYTLH